MGLTKDIARSQVTNHLVGRTLDEPVVTQRVTQQFANRADLGLGQGKAQLTNLLVLNSKATIRLQVVSQKNCMKGLNALRK